MPQGESPTVGGWEPSEGSCSRPEPVCGAPGVGGGTSGCGMSGAGCGGRSCLPFVLCRHQVLLLPGTGTVTPLRHLVGTAQVCGTLFLLFPREPQACGFPEGGRPQSAGRGRHDALSSDGSKG